MAELSITCPKCNRTSYHPKDALNGYCGNCHAYTTEGGAANITLKLSRLEVEDLRSALFYFHRQLEEQGRHTYKDNFKRLYITLGGHAS